MQSKVYVEVGSIRLEEETDTPIMLLQQPNTNKVLPIWIGTIEAVSIAYAQEGFVHPRPQTHDLLVNIIESLNSQIIEVCITDLQDKTYFHFALAQGCEAIGEYDEAFLNLDGELNNRYKKFCKAYF